ncbi:hypothetical protein LCGC14_0219620 [marine sediment metagenome]|uniref:Portal protein n=1 Tax=marine sediment metagenome TaxID=412755 RepID=A0A0F9UUC4_9ZZZZ
MAKKKPSTNKPKTLTNNCFYTNSSKNISNHTLPEICHITHGIAHRTIATDVSLRAGHNRHDYEAQRPSDKLPTKHSEIIMACQAIYRKIGMVRNIIDLMTDFAAEGLELQHTTKTQERFYRKWAVKVDLQGRAHDFMKLLMRDANVIVRRKNALITKPVAKEMTKGGVVGIDHVDETKVDDPPEKIKTTKKKTNRNEIPWRYIFLSPVTVEKIGGEVGRFFGSDALGMRLPQSLSNAIRNPKTKAEKEHIRKLPPEVVRAAKNGSRLVGLDMDKIYVDYYKKDDWEDWGTPFLYGVLEDVMFKEKMRLADMAALDGVINVIRLWKLGKSDQHILPAPALVDRLIGILEDNTGGGVMDLVWDDMIDLQIEYPPTDKILGAEKYIGVNSDIVRGLGIPDSLIGGSDLGTRNAQSAFVQLKTLVERLEYVRSRAIRWMEGELRLVADAMGFKKIPAISFGIMSLRDEAAEKQLIIQLLDRGIISSEKATEVFGVNYMIELERLKSEQKTRDDEPGLLEKSNPYNRPFSIMEKQNELDIKLEKVKQRLNGNGNDSRDDNGGGDNPSGDQPKDEGNNPPGRPPSTKDTGPRNERTPRTQSVLHIVADGFLDKIDQLIDDPYLKQHKVKNMRSLTKSQRTELDRTKRGILSVLRPDDKVTKELIAGRLNTAGKGARLMEDHFCDLMVNFTASTQKTPTTKERRILTTLAWANMLPNN